MTNTAGEPIIGATVLEKGNTTNGTITDIDGNFTINLPANATLSISYIGYITQEIQVGYQTSFKVVLKDDTKTLDEIIVVGYGSQKKANLTGAVSSVKMDEALGDRPLLNAADALQGAVPGLFVSNGGNAPGTSKSFQIRGAYSLGVKNSDGTYGNTIKPLVLIDNVEGDIDMINPEDIESINVLKDAASAAIYGARAAGGVILVTTKRPKGASRFELNYNNNFAFGKAVNLPKQAPLMDYLQAYLDCGYSDAYWSLGSPSVSKWMEYLTAYQKDPSSFNTVGDGIYVDESGVPYYLNEKDLYKNFMETSFQMTHNISASGGTDKLRYRISGGYNSNDGVLISDRDKFERMNVNSFISADVTKWFTQEITMSYAHSLQTSPGGMGGVYNTRLVSYYPEGELPASVNTLADEDLPLFTPRNQILYSNPVNNKNDNPRIFLKSILKPLKGLEAVFEYTFDKNIYDYHWYTGQYDYTTIQGGSSKSFVDDYLRKYKQHTNYNSINVYATYNKDFGNHHFKVMAGFNQESSYQETLDTYSYNQAVLDVPAMSSGTGTIKATDSYSEYAIRGGFFRVNYNYLDKYLLEVNGRYDGSSKFQPENRWAFFWGVSAGWRLSEEALIKNLNIFDDLKLRVSYGTVGNQGGIDRYDGIQLYNFNQNKGALIGGEKISYIDTNGKLLSMDREWETIQNYNVGLDFGLFGNRLKGTAELFWKVCENMLIDVSYPATLGDKAPTANVGSFKANGFEGNLNWSDKIGKVGYSIGGTFTYTTNKLTDNGGSATITDGVRSDREGYPLNSVFGLKYAGKIRNEEQLEKYLYRYTGNNTIDMPTNLRLGDNMYEDVNGDGKLTEEDYVYLGTDDPKISFSFNGGLNWNGFDFSVVFQGVGERTIWRTGSSNKSNDAWRIPVMKPHLNSPNFSVGDVWSPENPGAYYPTYTNVDQINTYNYRCSSWSVENGNYLRLKNISLGYTFPAKWLEKTKFLTYARVYVTGSDLWETSKIRDGWDPEASREVTAYGRYPFTRNVTFGLNLTF